MIRPLKVSPATVVCTAGALAMFDLALHYVAHGSNGDPPDMAKVVLSGGGSTSVSAVFNLHLPAEKVLEPGHIRGEAPLSKLFPGTPLSIIREVFKLI